MLSTDISGMITRAGTPGKTQNIGQSLMTKNFPIPKIATLDKIIFWELEKSPFYASLIQKIWQIWTWGMVAMVFAQLKTWPTSMIKNS